MINMNNNYYPHTLWISMWKDGPFRLTALDMTGAPITCLFFNQIEIYEYYQYDELYATPNIAYYFSKLEE
jgi:hypothetical protein